MKAKKLCAVALSLAMVLTSFQVPVLADEIVEVPVEETVEEETAEEVSETPAEEQYEAVIQEEAEDVVETSDAEGSDSNATLNAEGDVGNTYIVSTADDLAKYLSTDKQYALNNNNKNKDVTIKFAENIKLSDDLAGVLSNLPGDRFIHLDLNGHSLSADKKVTVTLSANTADAYKGYPSLCIENSGDGEAIGSDINFVITGSDSTDSSDPDTKTRTLLKITDEIYCNATITNEGGIVNIPSKDTYFCGHLYNKSGNAALSCNVNGGTVSGYNIALTNVELCYAKVSLNTGSSITGKCKISGDDDYPTAYQNSRVEIIGDTRISLDPDETSSLWLNVVSGTATMTDGKIIDDTTVAVAVKSGAAFIMNGGRIESSSKTATIVKEEGGTVTLNKGVVYDSYDFGKALSTGSKHYIIDGIEADTEDIDTEGDIENLDDLKYAFKHGGRWELANDIECNHDLVLEADLELYNKAGYTISILGFKKIYLNMHKLITDVNIEGNSGPFIEASDVGSHLTVLGGRIYNTCPNTPIKTNVGNTNVEILGGTVANSYGYYYIEHGEFPSEMPWGPSADYCAVSDGTTGYYNCAYLIRNGKEVVELEPSVKESYVLLYPGHLSASISDIFDETTVKGVAASTASVSYNIVSRKGNVKISDGSSLDSTVSVDAAANFADTVVLSSTYNYADGSSTKTAEVYATVEGTTESNLSNLANVYNATLEKTSDTMNAYAKEYKIYFDFHLATSEAAMLSKSTSLFKPSKAVINAPKGSKFSKYFKASSSGEYYTVGYDDEKGMNYILLTNQTGTYGDADTPDLVTDAVTCFKDLYINLVFTDTSDNTLFTVPITKYAYDAVVPEKNGKKENPEQAFKLNINRSEPALTFNNTAEGAGITVNGAFSATNGSYTVAYTDVPGLDDTMVTLHPGYFTGQDIIDASDDNLDVTGIKVVKKNNGFTSNGGTYAADADGLKIFPVDAAATDESDDESSESEKASSKVTVQVKYDDYMGWHDLSVPVLNTTAFPAPKLSQSTFSVAKGQNIANIPLTFKAGTSDSLGAITKVEVINNNKMFSVVAPDSNKVETDNGNTFTLDGYKLCVSKITGKKPVTGKIKVYFGENLKAKDGSEYTKTFKITAKPVEKYSISIKSQETLMLGTKNATDAVITLKTNPEFVNGSVVVKDFTVKSKTSVSSDLAWAVDGNKITISKSATSSPLTDVSKLTLLVNYADPSGTSMLSKDKKISVKINKKLTAAPKKTSVDVVMNTKSLSTRLYNGSTVEADRTAENMAKNVTFNAVNQEVDSVSGNTVELNSKKLNSADLFKVVEKNKGKTVKITPRLSALKAGNIIPGVDYKLILNLKEQGSGALTGDTVTVNIKVEKDASKYKVSASFKDGSTVKLSSVDANAGAKFTIKTKKPFYGMKIKSVTKDTTKLKSGKDYFDIQSINGGLGYTASDINGGSDFSDFRVVFKDGKVPTKTSGTKTTLVTGGQKLPLVVEYENGMKAYITLTVNITR